MLACQSKPGKEKFQGVRKFSLTLFILSLLVWTSKCLLQITNVTEIVFRSSTRGECPRMVLAYNVLQIFSLSLVDMSLVYQTYWLMLMHFVDVNTLAFPNGGGLCTSINFWWIINPSSPISNLDNFSLQYNIKWTSNENKEKYQ